MVRAGIVAAVVVALLVGLAGCHILFGHSPGGGTSGDGRPRVDVPGELRVSDGLASTDVSERLDGLAADERAPGGDAPTFDGPSCDPGLKWCGDQQQIPTTAPLFDVDGADDASVVYAVGTGIVLRSTSSQRVWQRVLTVPSGVEWRGVHVLELSKDAVVVGNQGKVPVAFRVTTAGATEIQVALQEHTLYAAWMQTENDGFVATGTVVGTEPHGTASPLAGFQIATGNDLGEQIFDVDGQGADAWAVGSKGGVYIHDGNKWSYPHTLPGAQLRTSALGPKSMCAAGLSALGIVTCCVEYYGIACPVTQSPGFLLRSIAASHSRLIVVGDAGAIASASLSVGGGQPPVITLKPFSAEPTGVTQTLHGVWVSRPKAGLKADAWAVGETGTILHRQYPP